MAAPSHTVVHATGLALDGIGVLIRGPSGAGKSLLALDLLDHFDMQGKPACLVADDGVIVAAGTDGIEMRTPPAIAGLIELRGYGPVRRPHVPAHRLDLIVDLVSELVRLPPETAFLETLSGMALPRCPVPVRDRADPVHQRLLVLQAMSDLAGRDKKTT